MLFRLLVLVVRDLVIAISAIAYNVNNNLDEVLLAIVGTLSSGNADGDGDAETCEKAGERTPLWREFTNIKRHRRKPRFPH